MAMLNYQRLLFGYNHVARATWWLKISGNQTINWWTIPDRYLQLGKSPKLIRVWTSLFLLLPLPFFVFVIVVIDNRDMKNGKFRILKSRYCTM